MPRPRRVAIVIDLSYPLRHHHDVFAGIQAYAREHPHWECVVQPFISDVQGYDGIIARATSELAEQAVNAGVPAVNVSTGPVAKILPTVISNFVECGRLAAKHLLDRGFRRFAFQGYRRHAGTQDALDGFKATIRDAQCGLTSLIVSPNFNESASSWKRYATRLESWIAGWKPPLGAFVLQDTFCRYVAHACLNRHLRIPDDVALIGTGNETLVCTQPEPSLSSIDAGFKRVGYQAAMLLEGLMDGAKPPKTPVLIEPRELVVRRSTDVFVVDDPQVAAALRYMASHSHEGIRVTDVARHVHASRRSLERGFSQVLGRTMAAEICRLRLERAKRLLVESEKQIKEVARECGFATAHYFSEAFVAAEGISPGEHRRQHRV